MTTILIIEDDYRLRKNLTELLREEGYETEAAENGAIGLGKAKNIIPDLIISDVLMPEMDGFEVLEELLKDQETADIPFIFLTAKVEKENLRKGMNLGADDYLFKPFGIDELLDAVKMRLKKKELNDYKTLALREQLTAKIPHELRTPLVPILGYAEMIETEEDPVVIKDMVKIIGYSSKILHKRIEKFLIYKDLCVKEKGKNFLFNKQNQTRISSNLVCNYLLSIQEDLNARERTKINLQPQTLCISDWHLQTVVTELIENGLKFSGGNSNISLEGCTKDDSYFITVRDNGRGMSKHEIKAITAFNKFGEDKLSEHGLGLGLAIVKKIAELHGGSFNINSEKGNSTTCEVSLPVESKDYKIFEAN